ncbi:MAG: hypothetical protein GY719_36910 [bacterium]|nr:hypothetical protein [bacterium]
MKRTPPRVLLLVVLGLCSVRLAIAQVILDQDVATEQGMKGLSAAAHELNDLYSPSAYIGKGSLIKFPLTGGQVVTGRVSAMRPRNRFGAEGDLLGGSAINGGGSAISGGGSAISGRVVYGELQGGATGKFQLLDDQGTLRSNVEVVTSSTESTLYRISTTENLGSVVSGTTLPHSELMCDEDSNSFLKLQ